MITLVFAILTFALLVKLNEILGANIGFKIDKKNFGDTDVQEAEIKEVSEQKEILRIISQNGEKFDLEDFLKKAKRVFEMVFNAYADGDKPTLKELLAPRTFKAFSMAIDDRKHREETLEGSILQFVETALIDANVENDSIYVTVKFITDQTTTLRRSDGVILEGNPDYVNTRTDIWIFSKKASSSDPRWFLHEIRSED